MSDYRKNAKIIQLLHVVQFVDYGLRMIHMFGGLNWTMDYV